MLGPRRIRIVLVSALAVILIAGVSIVAGVIAHQTAVDRYVALVRSYPGVNFGSVPDKQLAYGYDRRCDSLETFPTAQAAAIAAVRNSAAVAGSAATPAEVAANTMAAWSAAAATC